jgi:hypothetical protein
VCSTAMTIPSAMTPFLKPPILGELRIVERWGPERWTVNLEVHELTG